MTFIYLDYNATTPVHPEVFKAMKPYLTEQFGNPSSPHVLGVKAKSGVDEARTQVASLIGCAPEEIVFTSGGSESNNQAIKSIARSLKGRGRHIITSQIEHPAVTKVCQFLEEDGFEVTYLPVDSCGLVNLDAVKKAFRSDTILITIMHANNEVGTIQPISSIAGIAKEKGVLLHTDAAQSVAKIPVRVEELGVDLLSIAGHKLYAPKGVGALYVRGGIVLDPLIHGAGHESGRRAGTENVASVVGLGKACEIALGHLEQNTTHLRRMRDLLHELLLQAAPDALLNGHPDQRLPNTLSLAFPNLTTGEFLSALEDLAVSAGAACHEKGGSPSPVLTAMGIPLERAMGTIRFSTGHFTTEEEIRLAASQVAGAIERLRE